MDDAIEAVRQRGGRLTVAKSALLRVLFEEEGDLTAEALCERLPDVDHATVYRTLAQLETAGVICHRHLAHGPATYRRVSGPTIAIVCEGCGAVAELDAQDYRSLARRAKERHGMTLVPGHFSLTGWCDRCLDGL